MIGAEAFSPTADPFLPPLPVLFSVCPFPLLPSYASLRLQLYHVSNPNTWSGRWDIRLRRNSPSGEEVCHIVKKGLAESFTVTMATCVLPPPLSLRFTPPSPTRRADLCDLYSDGKENKCAHSGFFKTRYDFLGGGGTYTWKNDSSWSHAYDYSVRLPLFLSKAFPSFFPSS